MKFADYSPPSPPTVEQQHDALRKGLGRALQWAKSGMLNEGPLLDACLHDLRFDYQVDDCRGAWLWQLLSEAKCEQKFRQPILEGLQSLSNEDDAQQLCELGFHFAKQADEQFRKRLYEIVEQKPFSDFPWLGEEQLVALDGSNGLLFSARVRGAQLSVREWEWDDLNPVEVAIKQMSEEQVLKVLNTVEDEPIKRYRDAWLRHRTRQTSSTQSHKERMQAISVKEIIDAAEAEDTRYGKFRGWGMYASAGDLELVLARLLNSRHAHTVANYLMVFSNRTVPRLDPTLFSLCEHEDETVRNRALRAIAQNVHPDIREFALRQLDRGVGSGAVVSLFIKNYQEHDDELLLQSLRIPEDHNELHWLLMEIIDVLEANPQADSSQLAVIAYALTPCASCRFRAARHMHKQHTAPQWLIDECHGDTEIDTRQLKETTADMAVSDP